MLGEQTFIFEATREPYHRHRWPETAQSPQAQTCRSEALGCRAKVELRWITNRRGHRPPDADSISISGRRLIRRYGAANAPALVNRVPEARDNDRVVEMNWQRMQQTIDGFAHLVPKNLRA